MGTATPLDVSKTSTPSLFAAVLDDARELAIGHLERMQRETAGELSNLKRAIARTAIAIAIVIVGAVLGGQALAAGMIALGLPAWASYALAAGAAMVSGIVLLKRWPSDSSEIDLVPEQSLADLKRDVGDAVDAARAG
jgi:hypothetical protein